MEVIGSFDAKTHFSALLKKVESGEEIVITRRGKAIARMVPAEAGKRERAVGAVNALLAFRQSMPATSVDEILDMKHEGHRF